MRRSQTPLRMAIAALITAPSLGVAHEGSPRTDLFDKTALSQPVEFVDCTLENGAAALCARAILRYKPANQTTPPQDGNQIHISLSPDETVNITTLIPVSPVMAATPNPLKQGDTLGVRLDGIPIYFHLPKARLTAPRPAVNACRDQADAVCSLPQDPGAQLGFAFDGFPIYGSLDSDYKIPTDLDGCNGHFGKTKGFDAPIYHYHASTDTSNLPPCLVGVQARDNFSSTALGTIGN